MKRPTGITILAIIFLALGGLSFIWSLLQFGAGGIGTMFNSLFSFSVSVSPNLWSGMFGMIAAGVQIAAGIGLLRMANWSWYLAVIAVGLNAIQGLFGIFSGGIFTFFCGIIGLLIPAGILFYLLQPKMRAMFGISSGKSP